MVVWSGETIMGCWELEGYFWLVASAKAGLVVLKLDWWCWQQATAIAQVQGQ